MALDQRRRRHAALARLHMIEPRVPRRDLRQGALISVPHPRGGPVHRRIWIGQPRQICAQRLGTLVCIQEICKVAIKLRPELFWPGVKGPSDLGPRAEKNRAQHHSRDALGKLFRIGQSQRRSPRAANDQPALDAKMLADALDIGDEVRGRVGLQRQIRMTAARTPLIE